MKRFLLITGLFVWILGVFGSEQIGSPLPISEADYYREQIQNLRTDLVEIQSQIRALRTILEQRGPIIDTNTQHLKEIDRRLDILDKENVDFRREFGEHLKTPIHMIEADTKERVQPDLKIQVGTGVIGVGLGAALLKLFLHFNVGRKK